MSNNYQDPSQAMMEDPRFEAIWQEIKSWDINVPEEYEGYCGATGNHVAAIIQALDRMNQDRFKNVGEVTQEEVEATTITKEDVERFLDDLNLNKRCSVCSCDQWRLKSRMQNGQAFGVQIGDEEKWNLYFVVLLVCRYCGNVWPIARSPIIEFMKGRKPKQEPRGFLKRWAGKLIGASND